MIMAGPPGQWPFGPGVNPVVAPGGWLSGVTNPAGISGAGQQNVPSGTGAAGLAAGSNGNAIGVASGFPSGSDLTRSSNGGPDSSGTAPPPVATKVRKPYTITKVRERWTEEEHERFSRRAQAVRPGVAQDRGVHRDEERGADSESRAEVLLEVAARVGARERGRGGRFRLRGHGDPARPTEAEARAPLPAKGARPGNLGFGRRHRRQRQRERVR